MIQLQLVREDIGLQLNSTPDIAVRRQAFVWIDRVVRVCSPEVQFLVSD